MAEQRYRVIDRLEAGGMAEVFVGEAQSVQGFKKKVAIKRVLPHLAQNKKFITMFLDEARLGAKLNHANIVTVFDIGAADNTYFIVMEYIDGGNLKTIMEILRKQGRHFPIKDAIYICMEACRGLSYAHELQDDDGVPLAIVHRDVSPPNLMLSRRGEIKVTDFGLAKATTQLEKTDPGVVKGKFSYLAPEQALGQEADARADVFALGVVLWEMLAGRRLFLGETDYQTVKLVQQANIPSLQRLNPEVDAEFEEVLGKALARDPNDRYQSAREMGDALTGFIFRHQMKVTSYDIANLVNGVVKEAEKSKKPAKQGQQSIIDRLIQEELLRFTSLDDLSDPLNPGAQPLSPEDVQGAKPLDLGAFENPAEWFSDDADVAAAIDGQSRAGSQPGVGQRGWNEAGLEQNHGDDGPSGDLSSLLESDDHAQPSRTSDPGRPAPRLSAPGPQPMTFQEAAIHAVDAPAKPKSMAWLWALVAVVVLGGAGAAAWFLGFIPH